ncbi:hypothetical protein [Amycolatopsis saalfeldensis]|uniref:Uncharacterized protein n=1 Tax=Amycolatopsis saalfeldensis TaxID=394193 RepID=A0A1H8Y624_9PSEU|nr:hypothetical protein [Amycolatopsis saalfeldensis]SEP46978.1 hypothetical protein SAMN04489732_1118 [Amycolatopsis saalfeldensis]
MPDLTPQLRRVGRLCASLESDDELRAEIERGGFPGRGWAELADAIRAGSPRELTTLLDAIEEAAGEADLDGVTDPTREFRPLPNGSAPVVRAVTGWRCPLPHRCGRVELAGSPRCAVTGDALTWISVDSR